MTIAHRLNTIIDSDMVLVMNYGEAAEYNHPHVLLQNNGIFSQMVQQTGSTMADHLKNVAQEVYMSSDDMF